VKTRISVALGLVIALLAAPIQTAQAASFGQRIASSTTAATTTNTTVTVQDAAGTFNATSVSCANVGPSLVYVEYNSGVAIAASVSAAPIPSGLTFKMDYNSIDVAQGGGIGSFGIITGASTATVYCVAVRPKSGS
jgi:hypothetical protein